jgi:hypothetical protein
VQGESPPLNFDVKILFQLFNTPGTEIAPGSYVVGEHLEDFCLAHIPSFLARLFFSPLSILYTAGPEFSRNEERQRAFSRPLRSRPQRTQRKKKSNLGVVLKEALLCGPCGLCEKKPLNLVLI